MMMIIERFLIESRKAKAKLTTYQSEYSANTQS